MRSISLEPCRAAAALASAWIVALLAFQPAAAAKEKSGQLCEVTSAVSGEGQLRDRTKKCKKNDVLQVLVVSTSLAPARVAALACDFSEQVLIEGTTDTPGIARVTCTFAGEVRAKR